ncbi:MAG: hypothetical protein Q8Q73_19090 [Stagnimonas sp.]|nr:hypothetical protein [Stagnimonas sp.]
MKARPILFSGPMVQALLAGWKTQTRRVLRENWGPAHSLERSYDPERQQFQFCTQDGWQDCSAPPCPYGKPGDLLIVREAFSGPWGCRNLKPSEWPVRCPIWYWADGNPYFGDWTKPKPSIHMPRWASRLTLRITDVRVERLQEISPADAKAEGDHERSGMPEYYERGAMCHVDWYRHLWGQINGPDSWAANPWVWVIGFEAIRENVDQVTGGRAA